MGVFDSGKKKISDLVGIITKGQATAANSLPVVLASDANLVTGATDNAAAAGALFPGAGVYQVAPGTLTDGYLARTRISARRGQITAPDNRYDIAAVGTPASADFEVSTTSRIASFATPTGAFFDGTDGGFGSGARYLRIPMTGWREVSVGVYSTLNNGTPAWTLWMQVMGKGDDLQETVQLDTASGTNLFFGPQAAGAAPGSEYRAVPALAAAMQYLIVQLLPTGDPTTGAIKFYVARRA